MLVGDRVDDRLLAREIAVESALADLGLGADLVDRNVDSLAQVAASGGIHDPASPLPVSLGGNLGHGADVFGRPLACNDLKNRLVGFF